MQATPECFAHLTQLLQVLAGGRVCAVLEVTGKQDGLTGQRPRRSWRGLPPRAGHPAWDGDTRPHDAPLPSSQGGYHLESLSQSVCMVVRALLGDPAPPLSGPMVLHYRCREQESGEGCGCKARPHHSGLSPQCPGVHPACPGSPGPSLGEPPAARSVWPWLGRGQRPGPMQWL